MTRREADAVNDVRFRTWSRALRLLSQLALLTVSKSCDKEKPSVNVVLSCGLTPATAAKLLRDAADAIERDPQRHIITFDD